MKRLFWIVPVALFTLGVVGLPVSPATAQSGSGSGSEIRVEIPMTGAAINGVLPKGKAEYRSAPDYRKFKVQVEQVRLPDGTTLVIALNGIRVGNLRLVFGRGELERSTKDGQVTPIVKAGDVVTATTTAGKLILKGSF